MNTHFTAARRRAALLLLLAAGIALLAAGCGGGSGDGGAGDSGSSTTAAADTTASSSPTAGGGVLNVDVAVPPASLDPAAVCSIEDLGLLSDLYPTLVKHAIATGQPADAGQEDPTKVVPYLAESWKQSTDGKTTTFKLRPGAKFPGGAPIDSAAVKFSWQRATAIGSCGAGSWTGGSGSGAKITSIQAPDAQTAIITLNKPSADFLQGLTSSGASVVDRTVLEEHGATADAQNKWLAGNFAGGGPYVVKSYQPGTSLTLAANPAFWGDKPISSQVNINFVNNDSTLLLRTRTGKPDIALGLTKQSIASLKGNNKVKIIDKPAAAWQIVGLPNGVKPFNNPTFREALTYAVPQKQILDQVAHGYGQRYYGPFPPVFAAYNADLEKPREYDLAKAKELLAKSGVTGTVKTDIYLRDGVNDQKQIATILQDAWKPLGVDLNIKLLSAAAYQEAVSAPKKTNPIIRFDGPSIPTPGWLVSYDAACGNAYNQSNYCNKKVDGLYAKAVAETDDQARQAIWDQITRLWVTDSPRAVIYAQNYDAVLKPDVTHYVYGQNDLLFHLWGR
jgi:peptide/nickel transport system substrate-binding protein